MNNCPSSIAVRCIICFGIALLILLGYLHRANASDSDPAEPFVDASKLKWQPSTDAYAEIVREVLVPIDVNKISIEKTLTIILPDSQAPLEIEQTDNLIKRLNGTIIWAGKVSDSKHDSVTLTVVNGILSGSILLSNGRGYRIRHSKENVYRIQEIDRSKFPAEGCLTDKDSHKTARLERRGLLRTSTTRREDICDPEDSSESIDVLVVYTDDALVEATGSGSVSDGIATIAGAIEIAVFQTDTSYANSDIQQRLTLLDSVLVNYTEEPSIADDLDRLNSGRATDVEIVQVLDLRSRFAADIVVLVTRNSGACGFAKTMGMVSPSFRDKAFAIVPYRCLTESLSFAHELGHIMGARHDRTADSTNNSPFAFNHGHVRLHPSDSGVAPWMTVMGTRNECQNTGINNCVRIDFWSNPDPSFAFHNDLTGKANDLDNHQTLNLTARTVANFKCSSSRTQ